MITDSTDNKGASPPPDPIPSLPAILAGMQPAYQNLRTGESHLSQSEPGVPALEYRFAGLPDEWIVERDSSGNPIALHPDVIAGYWRGAEFIPLTQLNNLPMDS